MDVYGSITIKLAAAFAGLWAMTRLLGKREIAQLSPFDFVSAMVLGDLVGNTIYEEKVSLGMLLFALALWTGLSYGFDKLLEFGKPFRKRLEGEPELLIADGKVNREAMRRNSMEFEELRMMLRQRDVFSLDEVAYAFFEPNGSLSVLKKPAYDEVRRNDLKLPASRARLPRSLVENGQVKPEGLAAIGRDERWLRRELNKLGFSDPREAAYAEWTPEGEVKALPRLDNRDKREKVEGEA